MQQFLHTLLQADPNSGSCFKQPLPKMSSQNVRASVLLRHPELNPIYCLLAAVAEASKEAWDDGLTRRLSGTQIDAMLTAAKP